MATGMKLWLGPVAAGCALTAVSLLPPMASEGPVMEPSLVETRYLRLRDTISLAHDVLRATRWSDSLAALAVRSAQNGIAIGAPPAERVTPAGMEEWRRLLTAELDSLPHRAAEVTIGVFFQPGSHGAIEGVPSFLGGASRQTYAGVHDGSPYCLQVQPRPAYLYAPLDDAELRSVNGSTLGACRLYAQYGMPGRGIQAWIQDGGLMFTSRRGERPADRVIGPRSASMKPFGLLRPSSERVQVVRCLGRDPDACAELVARPTILAGGSPRFGPNQMDLLARTPLADVGDRPGARTPFGLRSLFLLDDLEAQFGHDAFGRFWTSALPFPEAFADAFGLELGTWMVSWVDEEVGLYEPGPGFRPGTLPWSLLAVMALSALAGLVAIRRRV